MKSKKILGMKRLIVGLLLVITLGVGVASAQIVDVYNKLGSDNFSLK